MFLTLTLGFLLFVIYATNTLLPIILPSLRLEFGFSPTTLGLIIAIYGWSYALMQIPVGLMADRYEPRRILSLSMLAFFLTTAAFGISANDVQLIFSRLAMGLAASFVYVDGLKTLELYYSKDEIAKSVGIFTSLGLAGITFANLVGPFLLRLSPWRPLYLSFSLLSLIAMSLVIRLVPHKMIALELRSNSHKRSMVIDLLQVIKNPHFWLQSSISFIYFGALFAVLFWLPSFFYDIGLGIEWGGIALSLMGIGSIVGFAISGLLIDKVKSRNLILRSFILLHTIMAIIGILGPVLWSILLVIPSYLLLGLSWGGITANMRLVAELYPPHLVGTVYGLYNTLSWLGSSFYPLLVSFLLDLKLNYEEALFTVPLSLLVAFLLTFLSKETGFNSK